MKDLKQFYEVELGEIDTESNPSPPYAPGAAMQIKKPDQRKKTLEAEFAKITNDYLKLNDLAAQAKFKDGAEETPERLAALSALVEQFRVIARKVKVKLKEPLMDDGKKLNKFAMKELDPEKGDAQLAKLEKHMEIARQYFPHIKLKEIESADNPPKRIAIVLGLDAEEFNAVIMADKQQTLYKMEMDRVSKAILDAETAIEKEREDSLKTKGAKVVAKKEEGKELTFH